MVTIARMYDFESVSVSSFEAASLAATLTEKSADGWDVVAVVNAGSDVVAYLRRASESEPADADASSAESTEADASSTSESAAAELLTPTSVSSEPSVPTADTSTTSSADTGSGWGAGDTTAAAAAGGGWSGTSESSSWSGSAQQATAPATPAVPAGWYADPAGRFELRYWDGTAWTEHVSRGGQQYTDPPVA
jgi:hypothetical protein